MNDELDFLNDLDSDTAETTVKTQEVKAQESEEQTNLVRKFLNKRDDEETQMTLDFASRIIEIELEIKGLQRSIQEVKQEAKDQGVLVKSVMKAIKDLKEEAKPKDIVVQSDAEKMKDLLSQNPHLMAKIQQIVSKR